MTKKKRTENLPRRGSLPGAENRQRTLTFGDAVLQPFMKRFSVSEKKKEANSSQGKIQSFKNPKTANRSDIFSLRGGSTSRKKDSVSSDEVFETARSSITTSSNLSFSHEYSAVNRRSDGDVTIKISGSDNTPNHLEPSPRTRRGK